ncbi:MAG: hypothetical protein GX369_01310 [Euryarchaeota archaeon]|nr:hypothetical protein [Euryarchaeota archaeon]
MVRNVKALSIAVVIVIIIAAVSVSQHLGRDNNGDVNPKDTITFTDANGKEHSISTPISNVSIVHKYIPIFMKILGLEDQVAGLDSEYGMTFSKYFKNSFSIGEFSEPNGAKMISRGSKVIITPVTMGLTNSEYLTQMGITVIHLDLTNPYVIEKNLKLLVKLFGGTDDLWERYHKYMDLFNECEEFVQQFDFDDTRDKNFVLHMTSSGFYQTHASAAVRVIESISGRSYTRIIDPNQSETVYFYQEPSILIDFDGKHTLHYLFLYSLDSPERNYNKFLTSGKDIDYKQLSCIENKQTYAISTDCVNGAISCISKILYADAFGADVGDKAVEMVHRFNETFGLHYSADNLIVQVA